MSNIKSIWSSGVPPPPSNSGMPSTTKKTPKILTSQLVLIPKPLLNFKAYIMINQVKGTLEAQTRIHFKKKYIGGVPYTVVILVTFSNSGVILNVSKSMATSL